MLLLLLLSVIYRLAWFSWDPETTTILPLWWRHVPVLGLIIRFADDVHGLLTTLYDYNVTYLGITRLLESTTSLLHHCMESGQCAKWWSQITTWVPSVLAKLR